MLRIIFEQVSLGKFCTFLDFTPVSMLGAATVGVGIGLVGAWAIPTFFGLISEQRSNRRSRRTGPEGSQTQGMYEGKFSRLEK